MDFTIISHANYKRSHRGKNRSLNVIIGCNRPVWIELSYSAHLSARRQPNLTIRFPADFQRLIVYPNFSVSFSAW